LFALNVIHRDSGPCAIHCNGCTYQLSSSLTL
jgi:hypothetical protein